MQASLDLSYLRSIAKKYGNFWLLREIHDFVDHIHENKGQLAELASAYEMIEKKEDIADISRWIYYCSENTNGLSKEEQTFSREVAKLLLLFSHLGEKNISPFSSFRVGLIKKPPQEPKWQNLPKELNYLIDASEMYGVYGNEEDIRRFLNKARPDDMQALAQVSERIRLNGHRELLEDWLDHFPIEKHEEARLVWNLLWVISEAGVESADDEDWNTVEKHIDTLSRVGSERLATNRMWAARWLADFGPEAHTAIPHLRRALDDEDERVRVWAHYALACAEGNRDEHENAVREILSRHGEKDDFELYDLVGEEAEAALNEFHEGM